MGDAEGDADGKVLGLSDGKIEGDDDGARVGASVSTIAAVGCFVSPVGDLDGLDDGLPLGNVLGLALGLTDGWVVGDDDGLAKGLEDGLVVGHADGEALGNPLGRADGLALGASVGLSVSTEAAVGAFVADVGDDDGPMLGNAVGDDVGHCDGDNVGVEVGTSVLSQHALNVMPSAAGQHSVPSGIPRSTQRVCNEQSAASKLEVGLAEGLVDGLLVGVELGLAVGDIVHVDEVQTISLFRLHVSASSANSPTPLSTSATVHSRHPKLSHSKNVAPHVLSVHSGRYPTPLSSQHCTPLSTGEATERLTHSDGVGFHATPPSVVAMYSGVGALVGCFDGAVGAAVA